jgi:hypothetical protein
VRTDTEIAADLRDEEIMPAGACNCGASAMRFAVECDRDCLDPVLVA